MTHFPSICLGLPLVALACGGDPNTSEPNLLLADKENVDTQAQGARSDEGLDLGPLVLRDVCIETQGQRCSACEVEQERKWDDCWDTCTQSIKDGFFVDCSNTCPAVGSSRTCDTYCNAEPTECRTWEYEFEVVSTLDADHENSCLVWTKRDESCGFEPLGIGCATAARVETPEAKVAYECFANAPCEQDLWSCFEPLPFTNLAEQVQSRCQDEPLSEDVEHWLDVQSGWVRPEVSEALFSCVELSCGIGRYDECVTAWILATLGSAP